MNSLIDDFGSCNIDEFKEFTKLLRNWKKEILNSFTLINGVRINSSVAESVNAQVSAIIYNTRCIRNHERCRKRILYAINKDGFQLK